MENKKSNSNLKCELKKFSQHFSWPNLVRECQNNKWTHTFFCAYSLMMDHLQDGCNYCNSSSLPLLFKCLPPVPVEPKVCVTNINQNHGFLWRGKRCGWRHACFKTVFCISTVDAIIICAYPSCAYQFVIIIIIKNSPVYQSMQLRQYMIMISTLNNL